MNRLNNFFTNLAALAFAAAFTSANAYGAAVDVSAVENVKPALPIIPSRTFTLTDFGAVGDGHTLNTDAFIAQQNISRYQETGKIDAIYLASLSDDALPDLLPLLRKAAGIDKGSDAPNKNKVASVTRDQVREIA